MIQAVLLALIAGYVDTVGYLHFNAFAGLMTGNTIFMGIEAATQQYAKAVFHAVIIAQPTGRNQRRLPGSGPDLTWRARISNLTIR
jgi:hypothetical protein